MKKLTVGEFRKYFSAVINDVIAGEESIITYGKKLNVAVMLPFKRYKKKNSIKLGLLKHKGIKIQDDFEITEEQFNNL